MKVKILSIITVAFLLLLPGCSNNNNMNDNQNDPSFQPTTTEVGGEQTPENTATISPSPTAVPATPEPEPTLLSISPQDAAAAVILALKNQDFAALEQYVNPNNGVLFSPYVTIDTTTAVSFPANNLPSMTDTTVYTWGTMDGSGEPITLTFQDYYQQFVYDQDFVNAEVMGWDEIKGVGNTVPNIADVYPGSYVVDYHFSGFDAQYEGMDWESLILVLEEVSGSWYVSAIVHSQWTI